MMKHKIQTRLSIVALLLSFSMHLSATTDYLWTGTEDSNWNNPDNWNPAGVPGSNDDARINNANATHPCVLDGLLITVRRIDVAGGVFNITSENGVTRITCDRFLVRSGALLINEGQIYVIGNENDSNSNILENFGTIVNSVSSNQAVESGIIDVNSPYAGGIQNSGEFTHSGTLIHIISATTTANGAGIINFDGSFRNNSLIILKQTNSWGIYVHEDTDEFVNTGLIDMYDVNGAGLRIESSFENRPSGRINIGLGSTPGYATNQGAFFPNGTNGKLFNQGTINIDNTNGNGILCNSCEITNTYPGELNIGLNEAVGGKGIEIKNHGSLLINSGFIKIKDTPEEGIFFQGDRITNTGDVGLIQIENTGKAGIYLVGTDLLNLESAEIEINMTLESGILSTFGSLVRNGGDAIIRIDNTGDPAISTINNSDLENRSNAQMILCENGPAGTVSGLDYSLYFQGDDNYFINFNCAQMFLYEPCRWESIDANNSYNNTSYIYIDANGHNGMEQIISTGIINFVQSDDFNINNQGLVIKPLALEECTLSNAIAVDDNNTNTIGSTWYRNAELTQVIGTYSQEDNEFIPTNLPQNAPIDVYFTVTNNDCSFVVKNTLTYESFSPNQPEWRGWEDTNWNNPCNWDTRNVPDQNDKVKIFAATHEPEITSSVTLQELTVENGGHLTIAADSELKLEDGNFIHMWVKEGGEMDNYGLLNLLGGGNTLLGMNVQGVFNNYDSVAIAQHVFGGIFIGGTMNMYSGQTNVLFNDIYNVQVGEEGVLNMQPNSKLLSGHFGSLGADDVSLINEGTIANQGSIESTYALVLPDVPTIENRGSITNEGVFRAYAQEYLDTALINEGQITNSGNFSIESTQDESTFSLSNMGTITNAIGGQFDIIGFSKTNCLPGSVLINRGSFNHLKMEE